MNNYTSRPMPDCLTCALALVCIAKGAKPIWLEQNQAVTETGLTHAHYLEGWFRLVETGGDMLTFARCGFLQENSAQNLTLSKFEFMFYGRAARELLKTMEILP